MIHGKVSTKITKLSRQRKQWNHKNVQLIQRKASEEEHTE